jgi:hypothetical protein
VPDWSLDQSDLEREEFGAWSVRFSVLVIYNAASGTQVEFKAHSGMLAIRSVTVDTLGTIGRILLTAWRRLMVHLQQEMIDLMNQRP